MPDNTLDIELKELQRDLTSKQDELHKVGDEIAQIEGGPVFARFVRAREEAKQIRSIATDFARLMLQIEGGDTHALDAMSPTDWPPSLRFDGAERRILARRADLERQRNRLLTDCRELQRAAVARRTGQQLADERLARDGAGRIKPSRG